MPNLRSIAAWMFLAAAVSATQACAALVCEAPVFDFGARPDSDGGVSHTFEICNAGTDEILVEAVRSSCDCLTASLSRHALRPNERTVIDAHFTFGRRSGTQSRTVHVGYRDAGAASAPLRVLTLAFSGFILTPILRVPDVLDLGVVLPGGVATGEVVLLSGRTGPFTVCAVGFDGGRGHAGFLAGHAATNHLVRLAIPVPARSGPFSGSALAATDCDAAPQVALPYRGRAAPLIEARPTAVLARAGAPLDARVVLESAHAVAFRALEATATDARIQAVVQEADGSVRITSTADGAALADALIRVRTDHPVCHVIEIPVRAAPGR